MIGSRAWFALMRRNLLTYRKRYWLSTLLEMALPICFVGILIAVKNSLGDNETEIVEPTFPDSSKAYTPLSFRDYVTTLRADRTCTSEGAWAFDAGVADDDLLRSDGSAFGITGMPFGAFDWQNPFVRCNEVKCTKDGQDASKFCEYSFLGVAPKDAADGNQVARAQAFQDWIYQTYPDLVPPTEAEVIAAQEGDEQLTLPFAFDFVKLFPSESAMESYVTSANYGRDAATPKMSMGVVWSAGSPTNYAYKIRQNSTGYNTPMEAARPGALTTPDTARVFDAYTPNDFSCPIFDGAAFTGPRQSSCTGQYLYNGVITLQKLLGDFILDDSTATTLNPQYRVADNGVRFVPFPTKEYEDGGFFDDIAVFVPLLITLGLLYPVSNMISYVCREKELRQKELMKMMSVSESDIGQAWFASFAILYILVSTICAIVSTQLYTNSGFFFLWLFWTLTFLALICFATFIATFSSKTTRTVLIGLLFVFMGVFLTLAVDYEDGNAGTISLLSLHPVAAFSYGLLEMGRLEDQGVGVTSDTFTDTSNPSGYAFVNALSSLIVDILLWSFMTWYLNRVIAPDFGQALPWYFPCQASYWCPSKSIKVNVTEEAVAAAALTDEEVNDGIPLEGVSDQLRQKSDGNIVIRNLGKIFGDKTAVDNVSLTMYNGQVTALLGHNGAGKTTTISMLTGAVAPTSGNAMIMGKDLHSQLSAVRGDLGICLQHDCLFPEMTVREHVQFFSRLKGLYTQMSTKEAEEHVDQIIKDVALYEKRNTFSKNLSGGMKRKLSVAMAFCGGSKVVLLDEPTSGMDPFSRRFTWNVIRQYRQNRCILLTTHFMDEADVLGDRIAIMAEGQLRCVGSPYFLKKHYGVGYQLTIEKQHDFMEGATDKEMDQLNDSIVDMVEGNVKDASLLNNVGSEISFQLPVGEAAHFAPMFEGLDGHVDKGMISSYGVGITTMEEVFLLVARGSDLGTSKKQYKSSRVAIGAPGFVDAEGDDSTEKSTRSRMNLEEDNLFFVHVRALCSKRAANFRRDKKAWVCTTILPSLFVLMGLMVYEFAPQERALDALELTLNDYNSVVSATPRNPISVNNINNLFECQPGGCSYDFGNEIILGTEDAYYVCGTHANVNDVNKGASFPSCTVGETSSFMESITEAGVKIIAIDGTDMNQTSYNLFDNIDAYQASQYAAIYYTHDTSSVLTDGLSFNETVLSNCTENIIAAKLLAEDVLGRGDDTILNELQHCPTYTGMGYVIQYNFSAYHVSPTYMAVATEGIARQALGNEEFTIQATIHPLPLTEFEDSVIDTEDAFIAWFLLVLSFPFIAGSFATFVVSERESKAKHLQTVTGVKPSGYWVSTYLWDVANYQLPMWIVVAMFFIFDVKAFTTTDYGAVGGVITAMFLFGPAAAGFTYCVSNAFNSPALCNIVIIISGFLIGMGGPLTVIILNIIGSDENDPKPNLIDAAKIVSWVFRFHPSFCLGKALYFALNIDLLLFIYPTVTSVWDKDILLYDVIFLAWQSVAYLVLAIYIDIWSTNPSIMAKWKKFTGFLLCAGSRAPELDITEALAEDTDVLIEEERVATGGANNDIIVVDKLTKIYDNGKKAVNKLSLGIPPGQVFGLLGVNGAGKTTTMQMLTAEFPASSGDATLAGYSVNREPEKTRRRVGYCPQFDAHFANLTGREHVELYATIKGIPREFVKEAAAGKLSQVGLSDADSDRLAANYSGGMKRRLSLACATIGDPQIVFLDECSTGVDPVARREIWELVSNMVAGKGLAPEERTSVILTTHSMEECEALCPKIAIMANGRLRALGSAQHLKNKFGQGYQIEMKCRLAEKTDPDYVQVLSTLGDGRIEEDAVEEEAGVTPKVHDIFFTFDETVAVLEKLTGDAYLSCIINADNPIGYNIHKSATTPVGVSLDELAAFATVELRIRKIAEYVVSTYSTNVLRERQDTKVRYEVNSEGVKISSIFGSLEDNKERLMFDDYGVSQTSLEQVFNMHAAEAEKLKHGMTDG